MSLEFIKKIITFCFLFCLHVHTHSPLSSSRSINSPLQLPQTKMIIRVKIMDSRSFFNLAFLAIFLSHQALGSSRPFLPQEDAASPPGGMCSAAITIHGYKCQEFEVRSSKFAFSFSNFLGSYDTERNGVVFQVTTDDGYILSVQRIPEGRRSGGGGQKRPPVLLQHGVLVVSIVFIYVCIYKQL